MPIAATRALLRAALDGGLDDVPTHVHPIFGLRVPNACADVDCSLLDPRSTWADGTAYDVTAWRLARQFEENFARFAPFVGSAVQAAGIRAAA
jgi:phosphoenolpyruvate carboxykinase (ATP)